MVNSLGFPPLYLKLQGAGETFNLEPLTGKDKKSPKILLSLVKRPGKEQPSGTESLFVNTWLTPAKKPTRWKTNDQFVVTDI